MTEDTFTTYHREVGDFADTTFTDFGGPFEGLPAEHPVACAHDSATGLYCAIAHSAGQTPAFAALEARYQLAKYIAQHRDTKPSS